MKKFEATKQCINHVEQRIRNIGEEINEIVNRRIRDNEQENLLITERIVLADFLEQQKENS